MRYLPIHLLQAKQNTFEFPLSEKNRKGFYETLDGLSPNVSEKDRAFYFQLYSDQKSLVFISWIEENPVLSSALTRQKLDAVFQDKNKLMEHAFYSDFQQFISPFLYPICQEELKHLSLKTLHFSIAYSSLLPDYEQNLVQDAIATWFKNGVEVLEQRQKQAKNDQELHQLATSFLSDNTLIALNSLNNRHYFVKRLLIDSFLKLLDHPKSSSRLMGYVGERLRLLKLNPEHAKQLEKLVKDVKSGTIVLEKTRISWFRLSLIVVVVLLLITGLIALFFIDATPGEIVDQEKTAYMSLSKEERQRLDSLISNLEQEKQGNAPLTLDSQMPFIGEELVMKRRWENKHFQILFDRWRSNDTVAFTTFFSSVGKTPLAYVQTKKLHEKKGSKKIEFHNTSELLVLVLLFKNEEKAPLFSQYVLPKTVQEWETNEGEIVVVLPGNKAPSKPEFGDLPFKELDEQFFQHLGTAYKVGYSNAKRIKLIWETSGNESYLVDLSLSLEKI